MATLASTTVTWTNNATLTTTYTLRHYFYRLSELFVINSVVKPTSKRKLLNIRFKISFFLPFALKTFNTSNRCKIRCVKLLQSNCHWNNYDSTDQYCLNIYNDLYVQVQILYCSICIYMSWTMKLGICAHNAIFWESNSYRVNVWF